MSLMRLIFAAVIIMLILSFAVKSVPSLVRIILSIIAVGLLLNLFFGVVGT